MQVINDQWTPFLKSLRGKVSRQGRRQLLFQCIGDIYDQALLTFGANGQDRPADWAELKQKYADEYHGGDTTPTLILDEQNHFQINGTTKRLVDSFETRITSNYASITNTARYADQHQFGAAYKGLPARPYYPVNSDGTKLTPEAEARLAKILDDWFRF